MTSVDLILTGGEVVTMNEDFDLFTSGAIAIHDGTIAAVGPADQIAADYSAD